MRFVPLIGAQGWAEDGSRSATSHVPGHGPGRRRAKRLPELVAEAAVPLPAPEDPGFAAAFDRYADRRVVLLGEATTAPRSSTGARAAITRRLIERHGFTIVAVEADWPDAAAIDRYVRHREPAPAPSRRSSAFPTWMWRNTEVAAFVDWLREHNAGVAIRSGAPGSTGSTSTTCAARSRRCSPTSTRSTRRRRGWRASATAA